MSKESTSNTPSSPIILAENWTAEQALFEGKIEGLVFTFFQNERPLGGLSGLLDWRLRGVFSQSLRKGAISGALGECVYFPVPRNSKILHFILIGGGTTPQLGARPKFPSEGWRVLQKNLTGLKLPTVGISQADFGHIPQEVIKKHLKGIPVCLLK